MGSAYLRAAHLVHDPSPWILEDRLARTLVGEEFFAATDGRMSAGPADVFAAFRAHFVVRARLAEDVAVGGLEARRHDYVLLGAGADTFAWRNPDASSFTIWEIDHPASQAWKRSALERANLATPPNVRFLAIDLSSTPLRDIELPARATWNWLGVTQYLEKSATEETLRAIAAQGSATTLVAEFLLDAAHCDDLGAAFRAQALRSARSGEPMISFYAPTEIEPLLRRCGYQTIELLDADALTKRYLAHASALRMPGAAIFAIAST